MKLYTAVEAAVEDFAVLFEFFKAGDASEEETQAAYNYAVQQIEDAEFKSTHTPTINNIGVFGIYENSNRYLEHQVLDCKFLNLKTGIFCNFGINSIVETPSPYGQMWGTFNVKRNLFAPNTQSVLSNNEYLGTGAHFQNIINLNSPQAMPYPGVSYTTTGLNIMDNTFDRVFRGVTVSNFGTDSHIKTTANNTITILPDYASASQWGVRHTNNFHSVVNSNIVSGYTIGLTSDLRGVYNADNAVSSARCNSVVNLPIGMEFGGTNVGMIWRQNTMLTNSRGIQLSNTGPNGGIDQQGDPTNPSDKYWQSASIGDWTGRHHTWTDVNSWSTYSKLFIRSISGFTPTLNGFGGIGSQAFIDGQTLQSSSSETIIPCYTLPEHTFEEGGFSYQAMQIVLTGVPEQDEEEVSQYLLFFALDQDTGLVNSSDTLHEFYNSNISAALGLVREIEDLLATGQFTDANTTISNFSPASNIESNYKAFFQLYYSFITTNSLSTGALSDLEVLALQCPFKDGPAVYKARALYDLITKSIVVYNDNECLSNGYSERPAKSDSDEELRTKLINHESSQIKINAKTSFRIYPNPAENIIYIGTNNISEILNIEIRDVTGRVLFTKFLNQFSNSSSVEFNLTNGIYFVRINGIDGFSQTKKLVISK